VPRHLVELDPAHVLREPRRGHAVTERSLGDVTRRAATLNQAFHAKFGLPITLQYAVFRPATLYSCHFPRVSYPIAEFPADRKLRKPHAGRRLDLIGRLRIRLTSTVRA
jgi:hypothetical protein